MRNAPGLAPSRVRNALLLLGAVAALLWSFHVDYLWHLGCQS